MPLRKQRCTASVEKQVAIDDLLVADDHVAVCERIVFGCADGDF
jgi:hypothetical protein